MKIPERRIQTLEENTRTKRKDKDLPPEIEEILRRVEENARGVVLTPEEQEEQDRYVEEFFAKMREEGLIK